MSNQPTNKPHQDWIFFAQEDLRSGNASMNDDISHDVCFHAQQAAEKILKAFLVYHKQEIPKTHDLEYLLKVCSEIIDLDHFQDHLNYLNKFYIPTRYPDALPGTLPDGLPTNDEALQALEHATEVVERIMELLTWIVLLLFL